MTNRNLLIVHDGFDEAGGGEQMLLRVGSLASLNFRLHLALLWGGDAALRGHEAEGLFASRHVLRLPQSVSWRNTTSLVGTTRQFKRLNASLAPAAILAFSLRSALRAAASAPRSIPKIWMCQQSFPLFEAPGLWWKTRIGLQMLRRAGVEIVTISNEARARFAAKGIPIERLHSIPNSVDARAIAKLAGESHSCAKRAEFKMVCVARLDPIKNHEMLLRALAIANRRRPGFQLVCVGGESPHVAGYGERLRALASELGIARNVTWTGQTSDIRPYLHEADAGVLCSRKEAFGLSLAECGAAGLPLMGTNVGGIPEIVRDGVTGLLVPPNDAEALAGAMMRLADDPALAARLGRQARQMVFDEYDVSNWNDRWARLLARFESPLIYSTRSEYHALRETETMA